MLEHGIYKRLSFVLFVSGFLLLAVAIIDLYLQERQYSAVAYKLVQNDQHSKHHAHRKPQDKTRSDISYALRSIFEVVEQAPKQQNIQGDEYVCSDHQPCMLYRNYMIEKKCKKHAHTINQRAIPNLFERLRVSITDKMIFCDVSLVGPFKMRHLYELFSDDVQQFDTDEMVFEDTVTTRDDVQQFDTDVLLLDDTIAKDTDAELGQLPLLSEFSKKNQTKFLETFQRVIVVQHPIQKLVEIFETKYPIAMNRSSAQKHMDTLEDFIKYRINNQDIVDPALWTNTAMCAPCFVNYTAVLKLETMPVDANYLTSCLLDRDDQDRTEFMDDIRKIFEFDNSHLPDLAEDMLSELRRVFSEDMVLFDYSLGFDTEGHVVITTDHSNLNCHNWGEIW